MSTSPKYKVIWAGRVIYSCTYINLAEEEGHQLNQFMKNNILITKYANYCLPIYE